MLLTDIRSWKMFVQLCRGEKEQWCIQSMSIEFIKHRNQRIVSMEGGTTEVDIRRVPVHSMIVDEHLKLFEIIYDFCIRQV